MPDQFTFANPLFLLLLVALIPLVLLRARSLRFRNQAVAALVAPRLRHRLLIGNRPGAHWARFTLQLIALALLVVALAGPRYGYTEETTVAEGRNVLIGIDTSRSMLATDLQPDRLTRAKLAAHDLIDSLPGDRVGLIAFAGTSFLQAPLTVDHDAVIESISQLDTEIIPRGGTNIGRALALARETFAETESDSNAFILFSDGEDLESKDLPSAADTDSEEEPKVTVIAIGTGTTSGSIIPDPTSTAPGAFIRDGAGEIVRSRLDASGLRELAAATGGLYLDLNSTAAMRKVVSGALERLQRSTMEGRTIRKPIDRFHWALLPALLLLVISLTPLPQSRIEQPKSSSPPKEVAIGTSGPDPRTPPTTATIGLTMVSLLILSTSSQANPLKAWQRFQEGDFENASTSYEESLTKKSPHPKEERLYGAASSAYRLGDFEKAIRHYGEALLSNSPDMQERSHYSLGNALYREGEARLEGEKAKPEDALVQWRNALDHYQAALAINDANEDAHFNHDLVEKRIEELEKQQQQQQQQQENQDQEKKDQEGEEGQEGDQKDQQNKEGDQKQDQEGKGDQDQQEGEQGDQQEDQENQGGQQNEPEPVEEEGETPEGQLQAEENPAQGEEQKQQQAQTAEQEQPHPETGFTRSQARQILRSLADEDLDVRPLVPPSREAVFKNW